MNRRYTNLKKAPNAVTTPGGILIGMLEDTKDTRMIKIKRDKKMEYVDIEFIRNQLDKPLI
ncbi:MAG: hypothetical protein PHD70_01390 [Anaerostipes sp.]|jgi:hypothetical protein|nr:hypothetical protein [Anaerostipes sp.]MDD3745109.1 hypothetical protein [Anaerostipes sp.]